MVKRIIAIIVSFVLLTTPVYAAETKATRESALQDIESIYNLIMNEYVGSEITPEQLREAAIKGMFEQLDDYSEYYSNEDFKKLVGGLSTSFVGIGVQIRPTADGYLSVVNVFEKSPAEKAGIKVNDIIIKVNGSDIKGKDQDDVINTIKGVENTKVKITVKRNGKTIDMTATRAVVLAPSVVVKKMAEVLPATEKPSSLTNSMRYVAISSFSDTTAVEFKKVYDQMIKDKVTYLVLDLRDDGGGYLSATVDISKLLVPSGLITSLVDKHGNSIPYHSTLLTPPFKIAVLVNEYTASASEILASAIQDSKVGILVGQKTYGKGVVQSMYELDTVGAVKITTSEYLTRNGSHINKKGIIPNIVVPLPTTSSAITTGTAVNTEITDTVLLRALQYFKTGK